MQVFWGKGIIFRSSNTMFLKPYKKSMCYKSGADSVLGFSPIKAEVDTFNMKEPLLLMLRISSQKENMHVSL